MKTNHCSNEPRRDLFVNATHLHEQSGGHLTLAANTLSRSISEIDEIGEYSWCPQSIRDELGSISYAVGKALARIKDVQEFLGQKRAVFPEIITQGNTKPRLFKLVVFHGRRK